MAYFINTLSNWIDPGIVTDNSVNHDNRNRPVYMALCIHRLLTHARLLTQSMRRIRRVSSYSPRSSGRLIAFTIVGAWIRRCVKMRHSCSGLGRGIYGDLPEDLRFTCSLPLDLSIPITQASTGNRQMFSDRDKTGLAFTVSCASQRR